MTSFFKKEKNALAKDAEHESESGDEDLEVIPTKDEQHGPTGKELSFNHTGSFQLSRDMIIQDGETPVYFADVSDSNERNRTLRFIREPT